MKGDKVIHVDGNQIMTVSHYKTITKRTGPTSLIGDPNQYKKTEVISTPEVVCKWLNINENKPMEVIFHENDLIKISN